MVHLFTRFKILKYLSEDTFHTHFFNARRIQIPLLGRRSVNMSVEFLDAVRATQQVGSRFATWNENIFVHYWGPYIIMITHTVSTIKQHAYDVPVIPHALALRSNHKRLQLIRVERRQTLHRELLARICQYMCDKVPVVLSDDSYGGWLEESDSN